jgi:hypothetical protein
MCLINGRVVIPPFHYMKEGDFIVTDIL